MLDHRTPRRGLGVGGVGAGVGLVGTGVGPGVSTTATGLGEAQVPDLEKQRFERVRSRLLLFHLQVMHNQEWSYWYNQITL